MSAETFDDEEIQLMDTDEAILNFDEQVVAPSTDVVTKPDQEEKVDKRREQVPSVLVIEKRKVYLRDGPGRHHVDTIVINDQFYELPTKDQLATVDLTEEKVNELWQSLNLTADDFRTSQTSGGVSRPECLYVRGVTNMSTQAIFDYFEDFEPAGIEWVCDNSCNIFWRETLTPVRLLAVKCTAGPCIPHRRSANHDPSVRSLKRKASSRSSSDQENNTAEIALPPGHWREGQFTAEGKPDVNVKLYFRYTTPDDRKVRGAENQSEYYRNHGNPNYNNMTGLISRSRKRAMNAEKSNRFPGLTVVKSNDSTAGSLVEEVPLVSEENASDAKVKFTVVLPPKKDSPTKDQNSDDEDAHRSKRQRRRSWNDDDRDRRRKDQTHFTVTMDAASKDSKPNKHDGEDDAPAVTDARQILERRRRNRR